LIRSGRTRIRTSGPFISGTGLSIGREAYEAAIKLKPEDAGLHRNLGDAMAAGHDAAGARSAYLRSLDLATTQLKVNAKDAESLSLVALVEAKLGRPADARVHIASALALATDGNSTVSYRDAAIRALAGEPEQALEALTKAMDLGYSAAMAAHDPDLQILRDRPQFAELVRKKNQ
jgi:Flp pilus assembly protein TadD